MTDCTLDVRITGIVCFGAFVTVFVTILATFDDSVAMLLNIVMVVLTTGVFVIIFVLTFASFFVVFVSALGFFVLVFLVFVSFAIVCFLFVGSTVICFFIGCILI